MLLLLLLLFVNSDFKQSLKETDCQQLNRKQRHPAVCVMLGKPPGAALLFCLNSIELCHFKRCHRQTGNKTNTNKQTPPTNKQTPPTPPPRNRAAFIMREWRGYIWSSTRVWHGGTGKSEQQRKWCLPWPLVCTSREKCAFISGKEEHV